MIDAIKLICVFINWKEALDWKQWLDHTADRLAQEFSILLIYPNNTSYLFWGNISSPFMYLCSTRHLSGTRLSSSTMHSCDRAVPMIADSSRAPSQPHRKPPVASWSSRPQTTCGHPNNNNNGALALAPAFHRHFEVGLLKKNRQKYGRFISSGRWFK